MVTPIQDEGKELDQQKSNPYFTLKSLRDSGSRRNGAKPCTKPRQLIFFAMINSLWVSPCHLLLLSVGKSSVSTERIPKKGTETLEKKM